MDVIFLSCPIGLFYANNQGQSQRRSGYPDYNRGQNQHMGQWVGVGLHSLTQNGCSTTADFTYADIENEYRRLKQVDTDDLFDQVSACNNHIKPRHHQKYDDPVVVKRENFHV